MKPSQSKAQFKKFIADTGHAVKSLKAAEAAGLMLAFYREVRAADCPLDQDGDMLLFQWGDSEFKGGSFVYNLTRQFIAYPTDDEDDSEMSQLSLSIYYPITPALRALKDGDQWCESPSDAGKFEKFIGKHKVTSAVAALAPLRGKLEWGRV